MPTYTVNYEVRDVNVKGVEMRRVKLRIPSIDFVTEISRPVEGWDLDEVKAEFKSRLQKYKSERAQRKRTFKVTI